MLSFIVSGSIFQSQRFARFIAGKIGIIPDRPPEVPECLNLTKGEYQMLTNEEIEQFVEKAERELEESGKKIAAVSEAIEKSGFKPSEEVEEKARERLQQYEKEHEYENNQRMAVLQDEMYSNQPRAASSFRRRRGMAI